MKASKLSGLVMLSAVIATVVSCDPMEPSTYYEQFFRIGTVRLNSQGNASIVMDAIGDDDPESFDIRNFRTRSDMEKFGVRDSDRVVAVMDFNATETMYNNQITLNRLQKLEISKFADRKPADTLNFDYYFRRFTLVNVAYPGIWATGHIVNIAPVYYVSENAAPAEFYLDPVVLRHDTLFARLYSRIPGTDHSQLRATQSLLCFDMASLREPGGDADNQNIRNSILAGLKGRSSFTLTVVTPDSLRTYSAGYDGVLWRHPMLDHAVSVSVKFDF